MFKDGLVIKGMDQNGCEHEIWKSLMTRFLLFLVNFMMTVHIPWGFYNMSGHTVTVYVLVIYIFNRIGSELTLSNILLIFPHVPRMRRVKMSFISLFYPC